ncbi:adenosine kinase [Candidatus Woesearchaeota archaeon]|nr:adenosine kinase [Candidatus Woesearchaeota archaeon]
MKYDVFGIGSAIMDFLIQVHPNELLDLDLKKGHFNLVDEQQSKKILDRVKHSEMKIAPGGSCANSLYGIALLGGSVVFCGKVGKDEHGAIYEQKMTDNGVKSQIGKIDSHKTGHAITFITPDSERTFAVHLGASIKLEKEDLFFDDVKNSKILHIEGYQLEDPSLRAVALHAMDFAKKHNVKISIDLADPGIVARNKDDLLKLVKKYADIVFANEDESKALTGKEAIEALNEISKMAEIAVVKIGKKGSLVKSGSDLHEIKPHSVKPLDTTGAGDMYAAGFLYGHTHGYKLSQCGNIGSYLAAKVVEQVGARLSSVDHSVIEKIKDGNY